MQGLNLFLFWSNVNLAEYWESMSVTYPIELFGGYGPPLDTSKSVRAPSVQAGYLPRCAGFFFVGLRRVRANACGRGRTP
jgi:hypothetical protein